ncbi:MAG: hypothetical protein ACRCWM_06440 [Sarcina sp.]
MNKKIIISTLIGALVIIGIGGSVAYAETTPSHTTIVTQTKTTSIHKAVKSTKIQPNDIINQNSNPQNSRTVIINTMKEWLSTKQFNYVDFNAQKSELTSSQLSHFNGLGLFYPYITANGVKATREPITAAKLNKAAIFIKLEATGQLKNTKLVPMPSNQA